GCHPDATGGYAHGDSESGDVGAPFITGTEEYGLAAWLEAAARGERTDGFAVRFGPIPWAYMRLQLSRQWRIPPWEVDEAPAREIALQLRLMELEDRARP